MCNCPYQFSSVYSVMSDSLRPHGLQHARPPCPSPTPRVYSDLCPNAMYAQQIQGLLSVTFWDFVSNIFVSVDAEHTGRENQLYTQEKLILLHFAETVSFTNWRFVAILHWANIPVSVFQQHSLVSCLCIVVLVILKIFETFPLLLHLFWWSVIRDLWCYYRDLLKAQTIVNIICTFNTYF